MSPSKRDKQSSTNSLIVQRSNSDTPNPSPSKQQRQTQTQRQSSSRKRTSGWDRLWSLDYSFESGGGGGK